MIFMLGDGRRIQSEGHYHLSMFICGIKTRLAVDVIYADLPLVIAREDEMEYNGKRSALIITADDLPAIGVGKKQQRENEKEGDKTPM